MLYLTCIMITNVGLACYGVSRAKDICGLRYKKGLVAKEASRKSQKLFFFIKWRKSCRFTVYFFLKHL